MALDPTLYLTPEEAALYGAPAATLAQLQYSSRIVDAVLGRTGHGLVYMTDYAGQPAYMAVPAMAPPVTWTVAAGVPAGTAVNVNISGTVPVPAEYVGWPVVLGLDGTGNPDSTGVGAEVVTITSANSPSPGYITLSNVVNPRPVNAVLQADCMVFEERSLPQDRSLSRLSQWPLRRVQSCLGRYAYGRRSQQVAGNFTEFNLLAILQNFGGPPAWQAVDVTALGFNSMSAEVWVPAGVLLAYYSDARFWYVSGWAAGKLPPDIKLATAMIAQANADVPTSPMMRVMRAGDASVERFANEVIGADVLAILRHYKAYQFL